MNSNNSIHATKADIIFKDMSRWDTVGGRFADMLNGDKIVYYNDGTKRLFKKSGERGKSEKMTEEEIEYVVLKRIENDRDLEETKEAQKRYGKEIEAGRTYW
jgi:hypothetical protein